MKSKKILIMILVVITLMCMTSCQSAEKLGESPVPMHTVTEDDYDGYTTFEVMLPDGWEPLTSYGENFMMTYYNMNVLTKDSDEETIEINKITVYRNGYDGELSPVMEEVFSGKYENYENGQRERMKENAESLGCPIPQIDFHYQHYNGKLGEIVEIHTTSPDMFGQKDYHEVVCFFKDVDYSIMALLESDGRTNPGGEFLSWLAASLETKEHYTISDGSIERK